MGEVGVLIPIEAWLTDPVFDPDLKGPVAKARAELRGYTEDDVRHIWKRLDAVLTEGQQTLERPLPTFTPALTVLGDPLAIDVTVTDEPIPTVDLAAVLWALIKQKYPPLKRLIVSVDRTVAIGVAKLFAVLILHECAISRPEGAMRAASTFDFVYPSLRRFIEDGRTLKRAREAGGKETGKNRKEQAKALHTKIFQIANELLAAGREPHLIAGIIASRVKRTPNHVRRILRQNGISLKKADAS